MRLALCRPSRHSCPRPGGPRLVTRLWDAFGVSGNPPQANVYKEGGEGSPVLGACRAPEPRAGQTGDSLFLLPVTGGGARGSQGLPVSTIIDVDCVAGLAPGLGGSVSGVRTGPRRSRASGPPTSDLPGLSSIPDRPAKPKASPHHATFV